METLKYADDTTVTALISNNDETKYHSEVAHAVTWYAIDDLKPDTVKTQELITDLKVPKHLIHRAHSLYSKSVPLNKPSGL